MKTLVYLFVIAMLLFAGCAKDEMFTDDADINLKKAELKYVPLKANFHSETEISDKYGLPASGILVGNFSHLGKLIPEQSTWTATTTSVVFNPDPEGFPYLSCTSYVEGQLAAANGDLLFYHFNSLLDFVKNEFTSQVYYTGGTGRFENCTGKAAIIGYFDFNTGFIYGKVDGMITNVGSSK